MNHPRTQNPDRQSFQSPQLTRREFQRLLATISVSALFPCASASQELSSFVHPGLLHSAADLECMRRGVQNNLSPIAEGFVKLCEHPCSQPGYAHHAFAHEIGRNPSVNFPAFDQDANAAYQCSLMAAITGEDRYAEVALGIVSGWSHSLQRVSGADAVLMAGLAPFKLINAAEILRASGVMNSSAVSVCQQMLRRAILPSLIDSAPFANGNWDTAAVKTMLAISVFCDDRDLFERALCFYLYGDGDGSLDHYIYENGQCQESGRDQQHTQLGLAHMAESCEVAWHQGLNLYGALDNRLLKGFEYTASYILGDTVVFRPDIDRTGKYLHNSISPRSALRPVFELVLAHYHSRCGLQTPAVERAVQQLRPEGAGPGADQAGFGTLLYAGVTTEQASAGHLVAPAALHAEKSDAAIALRWAAVRGARAYSVERAESNGKFRSIQANIAEDNFRDSTVETTKQYSYRLRAHGNSFSSEPSQATHIYAGLPAPWKELRLGNSDGTSGAQYDGSVLTLKSAGSGILTPGDDGLCVYVASACNHLRARFLPQVASQSAIFGLMHRQGASPFAPCIGLLLSSESGDIEHHGWCLRMVTRSEQMVLQTIATQPLASPIVQFGRLMRPVWFRLDAVGAYIQARFSFDGDAWNLLGRAPFSRVGQLAIVASSGIATVDTSVRFDSILFSSVG